MKPQEALSKTVSDAVRGVRRRMDMGMRKFSRLVGSNPTSIKRCENGERGLGRDVIEKICEIAVKNGMSDIADVLGAEALFARKWHSGRKPKPREYRHRLVVVGFVGLQRGYLDTTREEAIKRWSKEAGMKPEDRDVHEIPFDDEFRIYSFFDTKSEGGGT